MAKTFVLYWQHVSSVLFLLRAHHLDAAYALGQADQLAIDGHNREQGVYLRRFGRSRVHAVRGKNSG